MSGFNFKPQKITIFEDSETDTDKVSFKLDYFRSDGCGSNFPFAFRNFGKPFQQVQQEKVYNLFICCNTKS